MFQVWLKERDISAVSGALKKADLENKLQNFMPPNRQTTEHFEKHFTAAGLDKLVGYQVGGSCSLDWFMVHNHTESYLWWPLV